MHRRRAFLTHVPIGLAGFAAACQSRGRDTEAPAAAPAAGSSRAVASMPAPLLRDIPATAPSLRWTPEHGDLVYTFGGAAPKHRMTSGTRIVSWTEDCFDGFVKTAS